MGDESYECQMSSGFQLARAYVPFQVMNQVFNQAEALRKGTLFPELYRPYVPEDNRVTGGRYRG